MLGKLGKCVDYWKMSEILGNAWIIREFVDDKGMLDYLGTPGLLGMRELLENAGIIWEC
jgi:hypothetical protein